MAKLILTKDEPASWWGGGTIPPWNLDQVVASDHLRFRQVRGAYVKVLEWTKEPVNRRRACLERHSDHGLLRFEIQR